MQKRQNRKPNKLHPEKNQKVPWTVIDCIMYSNIMTRTSMNTNYIVIHNPDDSSGVTSATYSQRTEPCDIEKHIKKRQIDMNAVTFCSMNKQRPATNRNNVMSKCPHTSKVFLPNF